MVFDRVPMPASRLGGRGLTVHKPDGTARDHRTAAARISRTGQPGVYAVDTPDGSRSFAVNLDPLESKTAPLQTSKPCEQVGLPAGEPFPETSDHARAPADVQRGARKSPETLAVADPGGDRGADRRNLAGRPARGRAPFELMRRQWLHEYVIASSTGTGCSPIPA